MARTAFSAQLLFLAACGGTEPGHGSEQGVENEAPPRHELVIEVSDSLSRRLRSFSPLPAPPPDPTNRVAASPAAARLGQALFFDGRLSSNGAVSCATCHRPEHAFTDGLTRAIGIEKGRRHTPTLLNVSYHRWLTWDGRADSLWMQALDPLEDPTEMGTTRADLARIIASDEGLRGAYGDVFGPLPEWLVEAATEGAPASARPARRGEAEDSPVVVRWAQLEPEHRVEIDSVFVNAGKAIAAYQRLLVRGNSPLDRFVEGLLDRDPAKLGVLSPAAQRGLLIFMGKGSCTLCHNGPNFSDGEFHNNALPTLHGGEPLDAGRYDGAAVLLASEFHAAGPHSDEASGPAAQAIRGLRQSSETWGEFRTPSLRNLAGRAPFMHQGQMADLDAVLDFYSELTEATGRSHHQEQILRPLRLTLDEKAELRAFLDSLNGEPLRETLLKPPSSPRIDPDSDAPTSR